MPSVVTTMTNTGDSAIYANRNLLARLYAYLTGVGYVTSMTRPSTSNQDDVYDLVCTSATVAETWTLTCTNATAGAQQFSVVGSVSGSQGTLTVNTLHTNTFFQIRIKSGSSYLLGDTYTFAVSPKVAPVGAPWEVVYALHYGNREMILKGKGLSGLEEIYIGFKSYENVSSDYYNITVATFTGYTPGNSFETQPGYTAMSMPTHNTSIPVWVTWNAQRVIVAARVNTPAYVTLYAGKFFPYAMPSQYPYPVAVGSMVAANSATRYSDTSMTMPYTGSKSTFKIRAPSGTWIQPDCHPWKEETLTTTTSTRDTNGYYPLIPVVMYDSNGIYGELDGVYYVSGFNNLAENTAVIGGKTYVFLLNRNLTGFYDYFAMRLD